jgi:hypothetical protein
MEGNRVGRGTGPVQAIRGLGGGRWPVIRAAPRQGIDGHGRGRWDRYAHPRLASTPRCDPRRPLKAAFYDGPDRTGELEAKVMPLLDDYRAVVVEDTPGLWDAWPDATSGPAIQRPLPRPGPLRRARTRPRDVTPLQVSADSAQVRKRREITGTIPVNRARERAGPLHSGPARLPGYTIGMSAGRGRSLA